MRSPPYETNAKRQSPFLGKIGPRDTDRPPRAGRNTPPGRSMRRPRNARNPKLGNAVPATIGRIVKI